MKRPTTSRQSADAEKSGVAVRTRKPLSKRAAVARPWITVKEAAVYLGVSPDTVYQACSARGLKHVKIGHSTIRTRYEWVDAWAETLGRSVPAVLLYLTNLVGWVILYT